MIVVAARMEDEHLILSKLQQHPLTSTIMTVAITLATLQSLSQQEVKAGAELQQMVTRMTREPWSSIELNR